MSIAYITVLFSAAQSAQPAGGIHDSNVMLAHATATMLCNGKHPMRATEGSTRLC
jgi:hypothetical protein